MVPLKEDCKILLEGMSRPTASGERLHSSCGISATAMAEKFAISEAICLAKIKKDDESFTYDLSDDSPHLDIGDTATIRFLRARNKVLTYGILLQQFSYGYFFATFVARLEFISQEGF